MTKIFTIGFAGKSAEDFFNRLRRAGIRKVIDTRLWADTQLAGFAKKQNLPFFLQNLAQIGYEHRLELAPSESILKDFKNKKINWAEYEPRYLDILHTRKISSLLDPDDVSGCCFLCAEAKPHHCHRRLLAEYLRREWPDRKIDVVHL